MSVFSERLKLVMTEKKLSQSDLAKITAIPKSAINQYLTDRFKPRRERTEIICRVLGVNPAWLMGLVDTRCGFSENGISAVLTEDEYALICVYRENPDLQKIIRSLIDDKAEENIIFRAAKSLGGNIPPSLESVEKERMLLLSTAPETDEDL